MKKKFLNFFVLSVLTIFLSYISEILLNVNDMAVNMLMKSYTRDQIQEILDFREKWEWLGYFIIPLLLLLKISIIAAILDVGCFFFEKRIKYRKLFFIVTQAEFLFVLVGILKLIWFYVFEQDYTLVDLQYFYPMSILNLVGYDNVQPWFVYPLQVVNAFEIIYWGILAYLLGRTLHENIDKGMSIVASSYGVGLFIWVIGVMFFTLNAN